MRMTFLATSLILLAAFMLLVTTWLRHRDRAVAALAIVAGVLAAARLVSYLKPEFGQPWFEQSADLAVGCAVLASALVLSRLEHGKEAAIRELDLITSATSDALWDFDIERRRVAWSGAMLSLFGYDPQAIEPDFSWWTDRIHPEQRDSVVAGFEHAVGTGAPTWSDQYRFRRADGSYAVVRDTGWLMRRRGRAVRMVGSVVDVSEREAAAEQLRRVNDAQRLLLSELDHRVRNNLAALIALIDLSRNRYDNCADLAQAMRDRIGTMAAVHTLLSGTNWSPVALRDLILALAPPDAVQRLQLEGEDAVIPPRQAPALGMVLHELMVNSIKYGALGAPAGQVRLGWRTEGLGGSQLRIAWAESGGPAPNGRPEPGLGTSLIEGLMRSELRGTAQLHYPPEGARHELAIALDA
jgi:PAS domain S-box-containing protein